MAVTMPAGSAGEGGAANAGCDKAKPSRPAGPDTINARRVPMAVLKSVRVQRTPVPLQRWHLTTLSPFFTRPLPSQFLHFCFFLMLGPFSLDMTFSRRKHFTESP